MCLSRCGCSSTPSWNILWHVPSSWSSVCTDVLIHYQRDRCDPLEDLRLPTWLLGFLSAYVNTMNLISTLATMLLFASRGSRLWCQEGRVSGSAIVGD
jgi:hypothetical protein